jgi:hypothetical protein
MYKYLKYKNKYTNLRGGSIKIKSLKNTDFKTYIMYLRDTYISNRHENGGIISINNQEYTITYNSDNYDSVDGNILYEADKLNNIKSNEIIWHTHPNIRNFKCEPPSGNDIIILYELAQKDKYPFNIAIHTNGFWIYKLLKPLPESIKTDFENFKIWLNWIIDAITDIYCSNNPNVVSTYDKSDLDDNNIDLISYPRYENEIKNRRSYKRQIKNIFKDNLLIKYVKYVE